MYSTRWEFEWNHFQPYDRFTFNYLFGLYQEPTHSVHLFPLKQRTNWVILLKSYNPNYNLINNFAVLWHLTKCSRQRNLFQTNINASYSKHDAKILTSWNKSNSSNESLKFGRLHWRGRISKMSITLNGLIISMEFEWLNLSVWVYSLFRVLLLIWPLLVCSA